MQKLWLVFRYEYKRHVFRWRFLLILLSLPGMILLLFGLVGVMLYYSIDRKPVGYVDFSGMLSGSGPVRMGETLLSVSFMPFPDDAQARQALQDGQIRAYYILPADFHQSHHVDLYYHKKPEPLVQTQFQLFLREKILSDYPETYVERLVEGPVVIPRLLSAAGQVAKPGEQAVGSQPMARMVFSFSAIFLFLGVTSHCSGYLVKAILDEKNNRTMEILVTSVSPSQLMIGKLLACLSIGLTQLFIWAFIPVCFLVIVAAIYAPTLTRILPEWPFMLGLYAVLALPTFLLSSALLISLSALVGDGKDSSDVSIVIPMLIYFSIFLYPIIMAHPDGAISVAFSLFPLTALNTLMIRTIYSTPPTWQILLSILILTVSTAGSLWLSGKLFRFSMLRYGQPLWFKEILSWVKLR